ncbi:MAG: hypothetical protein ACREO3_04505 [Arenimonas sp.]
MARAFVIGHKLLLLDEPFEGVSTAVSRRLARVVHEFLGLERDCAILAQRAFVIERGEIVEETVL